MDPSFPTIFAVGGYTKSFYRPAFDITPTSLGSLSRRIWGTETNPYYGSYEIPCHPETRIEEIQDVLRWIRAPPSVGEPRHMPMLWIHGSSGVGKSVIAQAIFTECVGKELVSSFFFSSARPTSNTSTHLVRKLLYDLVKARPELRQRVVRVLDNNPSIWESALEQQFETLIVDVLQSTTSFVQRLSRFWRKKPDLVVIDGLDEATEAGRLLDMILSSLNERRLPLRFIVFSTTNSSLAGLLDAHPLRYLPFRIAVDPKNTDQDIRTYLSSCFSKIRSRSLDPELFPVLWPSYEEFEMVILNAESRFLYASVIVEIVRDKVQTTSRYPPFLLTDILNETRANSGDRSPLDSLFQYIIACRGPPEEVATMLGSIFLFRFTSGAASPLFMEHIWDLSSDFSRNPRYFEAQLGALSYLVDYTGNTSADVHFIHASVIDFLREPARAGPVFINELQTYHTLVDRWLKKLAQWQTDTGLELDYRPIEVLWEQWATFITRDWEPDDTVISLLLALDLSLLFNHALSALLTGFRPFHSLFHNLKVVADWLEGCEIPDAQRLRRRFMNAQQTFHVQATIPPTVGDNLLSWIVFDLASCKYASDFTKRVQDSVRASASSITFVAVGEDCTCSASPADNTDLLHLRIREGYTMTLHNFVTEMSSSDPRLVENRQLNRALIFDILGSSLLSLCGPNRDLLPLCRRTIRFSKQIRGRYQFSRSGIVAEEYAECRMTTLRWLKSFNSDKDRQIRALIRSLGSFIPEEPWWYKLWTFLRSWW